MENTPEKIINACANLTEAEQMKVLLAISNNLGYVCIEGDDFYFVDSFNDGKVCLYRVEKD